MMYRVRQSPQRSTTRKRSPSRDHRVASAADRYRIGIEETPPGDLFSALLPSPREHYIAHSSERFLQHNPSPNSSAAMLSNAMTSRARLLTEPVLTMNRAVAKDLVFFEYPSLFIDEKLPFSHTVTPTVHLSYRTRLRRARGKMQGAIRVSSTAAAALGPGEKAKLIEANFTRTISRGNYGDDNWTNNVQQTTTLQRDMRRLQDNLSSTGPGGNRAADPPLLVTCHPMFQY